MSYSCLRAAVCALLASAVLAPRASATTVQTDDELSACLLLQMAPVPGSELPSRTYEARLARHVAGPATPEVEAVFALLASHPHMHVQMAAPKALVKNADGKVVE